MMRPLTAWAPAILLAGAVAGCGGSGDESEPGSDARWDDSAIEARPPAERGQSGGDMSIQEGSTVTMHFTMSADGEVLQSTKESEPFTYVQGSNQMLPAIEAALIGLNAGDKKEVTLEPNQTFGDVDPEAIQQVPKSGFQDPSGLTVGDEVRGQSQGQEFRAVVTALDEETVTLDLNHPLAGKTLTFAMEIVEVQ